MAGKSKGMVKTFASSVRVSTGKNKDTGRLTEMLYTPAYLRVGDQKKISANIRFPIMINLYKRKDPIHMGLVAWSGIADLFSKNLNQGKEMDFELEPRSYMSDLYYSDGALILDRDGSKKTVRKTSFTIIDFNFGADSENTLMTEINQGILTGEGRRPAQWNVVNSADNALWNQMLAARKATMYQGGNRFGFARVLYPREGGTILLGNQSTSAENAAGGQQNLTNLTVQSGRIITLTPGQQPEARVVGPPGGAMVQNPNVPLVNQVATALATNNAHCVKCGAKLAAGAVFCGGCGNPVVMGAMVPAALHTIHVNV
jgi:hypothetical protein